MGCHVLTANGILRDTFLIAAHEGEDLESALVDLAAAVRNDAHYNFLPPIWAPYL